MIRIVESAGKAYLLDAIHGCCVIRKSGTLSKDCTGVREARSQKKIRMRLEVAELMLLNWLMDISLVRMKWDTSVAPRFVV